MLQQTLEKDLLSELSIIDDFHDLINNCFRTQRQQMFFQYYFQPFHVALFIFRMVFIFVLEDFGLVKIANFQNIPKDEEIFEFEFPMHNFSIIKFLVG